MSFSIPIKNIGIRIKEENATAIEVIPLEGEGKNHKKLLNKQMKIPMSKNKIFRPFNIAVVQLISSAKAFIFCFYLQRKENRASNRGLCDYSGAEASREQAAYAVRLLTQTRAVEGRLADAGEALHSIIRPLTETRTLLQSRFLSDRKQS